MGITLTLITAPSLRAAKRFVNVFLIMLIIIMSGKIPRRFLLAMFCFYFEIGFFTLQHFWTLFWDKFQNYLTLRVQTYKWVLGQFDPRCFQNRIFR